MPQALEQDLKTVPACHPRACAIQGQCIPILRLRMPSSQRATSDCLTRNCFDESKCAKLVDALYECCQAFYEKNGDNATSASCPKAHLLRLKMRQRQGAQK